MQTAHDLQGLIADHIFEAVAFVGALLAIVVVFTQRQLKITRAKPLYRIGTVPDNIGITLERGGKGVDKKTEKKLLGEHLFYPVFLDKKEQKKFEAKFHLFYFPISIENNGNQSIEHLQIQLDYPDRHRVNYDEFLNEIPGGEVQQVLENGNIETSRILAEEAGDDPYERRATNAFGFTQVMYNIPIIRPGERFVICEVMKFPHEGSALFSEMNFQCTGYDNIVKRVSDIPDIRNNFPIAAYFRAANHQPVVKRVIVFSVHGDPNDSADIINQYVKAHWLGEMPPKGRYIPPPLGFTSLTRRLGINGALSRSWSKEHPVIFHSTKPFYKKRENGEIFSFDETRPSLIGFGTLIMPNIDFFQMPERVRNIKDLIFWLGFAPWPKALGGPKFDEYGKDNP